MLASGQPWRLRDFSPGEGLAAGAHLPQHPDGDWLPIDVPGDVHRALIAAGRITDPFDGCNEADCGWMEQREWWYRVQFPPAAAGEYHLTFEGLDTFATVYLNGQEIGEHHNMFRPARFRIVLAAGLISLAVRFDPPPRRVAGKAFSAWGRNPERTAMRKAQ